MECNLYQVDAFTNRVFSGNPACVMLLEAWLDDEILLALAQENAVAETAYIIQKGPGLYHLRWFTPDLEMDLCGHATLATAHVVFAHIACHLDEVRFETNSGTLVVRRGARGYSMLLPKRHPVPASLPSEFENAFSIRPVEVHRSRDFLLIYPSQKEIEQIEINRTVFDQIHLGTGGVIVSSLGENVDFVSRFFTPQATILEDPVTGSAHCTSAPFWAERLGKTQLSAQQLSPRGGHLQCEVFPEHVQIEGEAITYAHSRVLVPLT
ncbi:MAG: PhzF family phenazine biosynthesis protein [Flavobacteriales bacterium]